MLRVQISSYFKFPFFFFLIPQVLMRLFKFPGEKLFKNRSLV